MGFNFVSNISFIKSGNVYALKSLFTETSKSLIKFAFQITHDQHLAEEAVHDVFINIWKNREKIEITSSVKQYLYQAVHNISINKILQQKAQKNSIGVLFNEESWQLLEDQYPIEEFIIEKMEAVDTQTFISKLIDDLPDQCREVFTLSRFDFLSNNEIASKLNISPSTVKTQIYRALEKIKNEILKSPARNTDHL